MLSAKSYIGGIVKGRRRQGISGETKSWVSLLRSGSPCQQVPTRRSATRFVREEQEVFGLGVEPAHLAALEPKSGVCYYAARAKR